MTERYQPPSHFLRAIIADDVPLVGGRHARENLRLLIRLTRDDDPVNRDWATFLLAQCELDSPEVMAALLEAAEDGEAIVRAEAILGLALRDKALALPLVQRELGGATASLPLFEAAALIADPCFVSDLRDFAEPSGNDHCDTAALEALRACEAADGAS